ncbi:RER1B-like protein [Tanacetum coccineum]
MEGIKASRAVTLDQWRRLCRLYQIHLDKTVLHVRNRWLGTATLAFILVLRVIFLQRGYFIIFLLGCFSFISLGSFLSPLVYPKFKADRPMLPVKGSDEFRPFIRELSEFTFWYKITKACIISILMTFFEIFLFPFMNWPMVIVSFLGMFYVTMRRAIEDMQDYKFSPFSNIGKQKYGGKIWSSSGSGDGVSLAD